MSNNSLCVCVCVLFHHSSVLSSHVCLSNWCWQKGCYQFCTKLFFRPRFSLHCELTFKGSFLFLVCVYDAFTPRNSLGWSVWEIFLVYSLEQNSLSVWAWKASFFFLLRTSMNGLQWPVVKAVFVCAPRNNHRWLLWKAFFFFLLLNSLRWPPWKAT